jgi:hypothetical protein
VLNPSHHDLGQGAWVVSARRCGCPRWVGGGCQSVGVNLGIDADEYFDHTTIDQELESERQADGVALSSGRHRVPRQQAVANSVHRHTAVTQGINQSLWDATQTETTYSQQLVVIQNIFECRCSTWVQFIQSNFSRSSGGFYVAGFLNERNRCA